MKSYTFSDVVRVSGVTGPTVNAWLKKGVLVADVEDSIGRGRPRRFAFGNLIEARVIARLHNAGVTAPDLLQRAIGLLRGGPLLMSEAHHEIWTRLLHPSDRRAADRAWILVGPQVPGFVRFTVNKNGVGPEVSELGEVGYIVDVRLVIEAVERATGDSWS
jgi:hypothetical protein